MCSTGATAAAASDLQDPQILTGYIMAILEQQLGWNRQDYTMDVRNGRVHITLSTEDAALRDQALDMLRQVPALAEPPITEPAPKHPGLLAEWWRAAGLTR